MDYSIYVLSNRPHKFPPIEQSLAPEKVTYFDGTGYPSFSKLVNTCVAQSPTETVILLGDKVLPTQEHIKKMLELLDKGYAFVALYRFACFAFRKELFRRIGCLDERFVGGGFEDYDYYCRLVEANLAVWMDDEVPYEILPSTWDYEKTWLVWIQKWLHHWDYPNPIPISFTRAWDEEKYNYDYGPQTGEKFLSKNHTYIGNLLHNITPIFSKIKIISDTSLRHPPDKVFTGQDYDFCLITNKNTFDNPDALYFNTRNYGGLAQLTNYIVSQSNKPYIIIAHSDAKITPDLITLALHKLDQGYYYVSFHRPWFFAINRNIVNKVGWWDERFFGRGFEDFDYMIRMGENNIPVYLKDLVTCDTSIWEWTQKNNPDHWNAKYTFPPQEGIEWPDIIKNIPDEEYLYSICKNNKKLELFGKIHSDIDIQDYNWLLCLYTIGLHNKVKDFINVS